MTYKRNRVILAIIGFFIIVIPLFFFCYSLDKEYRFSQNRIQENLKERLISSANKLEENLDCYSYLKSEINKIHKELFPLCPEEVLDKIPEDSFTKNLYTKDLLDKIVAKTKDKFAPLMITIGTEGFKELYSYYSPELKKDLKHNENALLEAKSYFDMELILDKYYYFLKKDYYIDRSSKERAFYFYKLDDYRLKFVDGINIYSKLCYEYISRFSQYSRTNEPLYTDYFSKQSLFSIVKYTLSKKGIHGFYTLLIPQSQIHPGLMLRCAKSKIDTDVSITTENKNDKLDINQNDNGFEYRFNFSTNFKNHVNVFKKLRGIDKTFILNKQIKLSINYPKELIIFGKINIVTKVLAVLIAFFYIALAFIFKEYLPFRSIKLTKKLIYVLSIIILLPILGIGFLTLSLSNYLDELVDINVSKNLHNSLENYALIDKEITARIFSSIIEMKKKIRQNTLPDFNKYSLIDTFEEKNTKRWFETLKWFGCYNSDLAIISEDGNLYLLDNANGFAYPESKTEILIQTLLQNYMNNLSLASNKQKKAQEIFALTLLDQYINHRIEEKSVTQESIITNDFIFLSIFNNSAYYYAKDNSNKNYLLYSKINGKNQKPYKILHNYALTNPLWYQPNYKYAYDTNLAITHYFGDTSKENNRLQFPVSSFFSNINNLLDRILDKSESGYEMIYNKDESTINEYIFSNNTPFVIAGTTQKVCIKTI